MEKSIKRVENLVHVTNTALAQMKFSLMFDDINGYKSSKAFDPLTVKKLLEEDDLKQCQDEFKTEANEMLKKMESMFGSKDSFRKKSKAVDKIKDINKKMKSLQLDQLNPKETKQSHQKFLSLIREEKFSPSSNESARSKRASPIEPQAKSEVSDTVFQKSDFAKSPIKSKEELKSRILETQEIVNRGFQTARQLAQKVETISKHDKKEKTPNSSEIVVVEETESNETLNVTKCRRCLKKKKRKRETVEKKTEQVSPRVNTRVVVTCDGGDEIQRYRMSNLQVQRLPSVHIKRRLQVQKIHNLEIPAGGGALSLKSNTSINFLSHEEMKKKKQNEVIEKVRKENYRCTAEVSRDNFVKCFNCGKLIRVEETWVDPRKVDDILKQCNFNVFDPRIDEFVEKLRGIGVGKSCCEEIQVPEERNKSAVGDVEPEIKSKNLEEVAVKNTKEAPRKRNHSTLQNLSDRLLKKYKQETDSIESSHLKLDSILRYLFKQVDESREVFEECNFLKNKQEKIAELSATKPVLITLAGERRFRRRRKSRTTEVADAVNVAEDSSRIRKESCGASRPVKSAETKTVQSRISSFTYFTPNGIDISDNKEMSGKLNGRRELAKMHELREKKGGMSSTAMSSSNESGCPKPSENVIEKEDIEEVFRTSWIDRETAKNSDGILQNEEFQTKSPASNDWSRKPLEPRVGNAVSDEGSSSGRGSKRNLFDFKTKKLETFDPLTVESDSSKTNLREEVKKTLIESVEKLVTSDTSTEKSENIYESDFESNTNEPDENGDECEEEELEGKVCANKLSTISEENSELEKKVSDEQNTLGSKRNLETGDTSKVLEVNLQEHEKADSDPDISTIKKKTVNDFTDRMPTELVTSLKGILSALKDQFARTESLAEKLTENTKSERIEKTRSGSALAGDVMLMPWKMPIGMNFVENLRSARKEFGRDSKSSREPNTPEKTASEGSKKSEKLFSSDSLSDDGGSSLGEIRLSARRKQSESASISESSFLRYGSGGGSARVSSARGETKTTPAIKLDVSVEEVLYSEGEIPDDESLAFEGIRTGSLGEIGLDVLPS